MAGLEAGHGMTLRHPNLGFRHHFGLNLDLVQNLRSGLVLSLVTLKFQSLNLVKIRYLLNHRCLSMSPSRCCRDLGLSQKMNPSLNCPTFHGRVQVRHLDQSLVPAVWALGFGL